VRAELGATHKHSLTHTHTHTHTLSSFLFLTHSLPNGFVLLLPRECECECDPPIFLLHFPSTFSTPQLHLSIFFTFPQVSFTTIILSFSLTIYHINAKQSLSLSCYILLPSLYSFPYIFLFSCF